MPRKTKPVMHEKPKPLSDSVEWVLRRANLDLAATRRMTDAQLLKARGIGKVVLLAIRSAAPVQPDLRELSAAKHDLEAAMARLRRAIRQL